MKSIVRRWISVGSLMAAFIVPITVFAQSAQTFDLPAQSLSDSLREFGNQVNRPGFAGGSLV